MNRRDISIKMDLMLPLIGSTINGKHIRYLFIVPIGRQNIELLCANTIAGKAAYNQTLLEEYRLFEAYAIYTIGTKIDYQVADQLLWEALEDLKTPSADIPN